MDVIVSYLERRPYIFELIVAADGIDGTCERVERRARTDARVRLAASVQRRGKGRAVRDAVTLARGRLIGYVDADGKTPVEEIEKLRDCLEQGFDLALGSRALPGSRVEGRRPLHRRLGSALFAAIVPRLFGLDGIRDTQCGLKLFRAEVARDLFSRQRVDGYMFDVELLMLARASGYRICEVPIRWGDDGDSRLDPLKGSLRIVADLLRIRAGTR